MSKAANKSLELTCGAEHSDFRGLSFHGSAGLAITHKSGGKELGLEEILRAFLKVMW